MSKTQRKKFKKQEKLERETRVKGQKRDFSPPRSLVEEVDMDDEDVRGGSPVKLTKKNHNT